MTERQFKATLANARKVALIPLFQTREARGALRSAAAQTRLAERSLAALRNFLPEGPLARVRVAAPGDGLIELITSDRATLDKLRGMLGQLRPRVIRGVPGARQVQVVFEKEAQSDYGDPD